MVGEKLMLSVNFHTCPIRPMVLKLWLQPGTEPLRFSCGRKVTDVIRASNLWEVVADLSKGDL